MKVLICAFSGTGNTRRACGLLAREAEKYGVEWEYRAIEKGAPVPELSQYDALVVGFPVHAFNAPKPVLKFLKKLQKSDKMPAYFVRTSGEPLKLNAASVITPARILRRRGFDVRGEFPFVMPYNIIFRHSDGMAARMERAAELLSARYAPMLAKGEGALPRINVFRRFVAFALRIEHPAMPILGKTFRAAKSCVGCGKCAAVCPQKNIVMKNGKPKFGGSCVGCMGCAFGCPADAVRPSLLNGWRVNGAYAFGGEPARDEEVCRYCNRAYLRYFHDAEAFSPESAENREIGCALLDK